MIFTRIDNVLVCIVEQGDVDRLRGGRAVIAPDRSFMLKYTPDMKFTENQLQDALSDGLAMDFVVLDRIMEESKKRKTVTR